MYALTVDSDLPETPTATAIVAAWSDTNPEAVKAALELTVGQTLANRAQPTSGEAYAAALATSEKRLPTPFADPSTQSYGINEIAERARGWGVRQYDHRRALADW